jgi:hypothetical protein
MLNVRLSSNGAAKMMEHYRAMIGSQYDVHATSTGELSIGIDCQNDSRSFIREHLDFLTDGAIERGDVGLECRRPSGNGRYWVKVQIRAMAASLAEELGLAPSLSHIGTQMVSDASVLQRLKDLSQTGVSWNLGEPRLVVELGAKARLLNGTEVVTGNEFDRQTGESKPHFKTVGLELEARVLDENQGFVRVALLTKMKTGSRQNSSKLSSNELETQVSLPLATESIIGISELVGEQDAAAGSKILSGIPIIGPLFTIKKEEFNQTVVVVSLEIESIGL